MSKFTYETKDGTTTGFVPGYGAIVDGKITTEKYIESPNLVLQDNAESEQAEPGQIIGVASQQNPEQSPTADGTAPDTNIGVLQ